MAKSGMPYRPINLCMVLQSFSTIIETFERDARESELESSAETRTQFKNQRVDYGHWLFLNKSSDQASGMAGWSYRAL